ncbi:hypothetical protein BCO71033_00173 [Burkholderia contaminans]|uniref:Uncharacterized protein n=1 Tax=Burkholderia contaminans TaxID=488447 RepID=A0A6P2V0E3_9BURK|nr:hypothetical protein BCO71033_00173 [Burkholderia contaminans]
MLCTLLRRGMHRVRHDVMRCMVDALPGRVVPVAAIGMRVHAVPLLFI